MECVSTNSFSCILVFYILYIRLLFEILFLISKNSEIIMEDFVATVSTATMSISCITLQCLLTAHGKNPMLVR